ncbi:MAG: hypothetical protein RI973_2454 [Bacteroidota bacterium]|jgi:hypothetical protein
MENPLLESKLNINRRAFFSRLSVGVGSLALGSLLTPNLLSCGRAEEGDGFAIPGLPHFLPKAKRVIYLFQSGAPSQLESFDYKPMLRTMHGQDLPESIRMGQRLTTMTSGQSTLPLVGSGVDFKQYGQNGTWISDFFPYTGQIADEICVVRSMFTEAINHDPAITFFQTGHQQGGRPSMGAWMSYGLGSENENLPAFVVLTSRGGGNSQGLYAHLWSSGFLDSAHQGVLLRGGKEPVLYLNNPEGIGMEDRRKFLDNLSQLNQSTYDEFGDPEIVSRIRQYEMAYRMQTSVPEVMDLGNEPEHILRMYGPDVLTPGTFAANCLLARKLAEKGVRFIQLYHQGWDQHGNLVPEMGGQARQTDQSSAALVLDLKQRGLLDDTLVIWGGEFGRTNYCQGPLDLKIYGRDHHPRCFSIWMAGAGVKPGTVYGETDELGYNIVKDPVHIHDFHATVMHLMGLDHAKLTFKHQGRRYRLTDVAGEVVKGLIA